MTQKIRNFCIIAHIDHGKSTLADRMLEITGTIKKLHWTQVLDKMDIEQERGITIKLTPARMSRKWYEFNLIDTPWHVDFQYEVSRSIASVEGAILLVDATQWIQAQTLSTLYSALDNNLEIIPVLNKIDLPAANPDRVAEELENLIWIDRNNIIKISAKTWENVNSVLDRIIEQIPAHKTQIQWVTKALIFDSVYDKYKWVVAYVKLVEGEIKAGEKLLLIHSEKEIIPPEVWYFNPDYYKDKSLKQGQIWYIVTWQKSVRDVKIWDTIFRQQSEYKKESMEDMMKYVIPWFKKVKPYVYAWVYPMDTEEYEKLKIWFDKLSLNDSAIEYEYENSVALGHWFRCWFLWTLHMDIVKERIFREYDVDTIFTVPNVVYLVKLKLLNLDKVKSWANIVELVKTWYYKQILKHHPDQDNLLHQIISSECSIRQEIQLNQENNKNISSSLYLSDMDLIERYRDILKDRLLVRSWAEMPDPWFIDEIYEPYAEVEIIWPKDYSWNIMELVQEYRWDMKNMEYIDKTVVLRRYFMPLWEIIVDFYDRLKSSTKWYATMNYEFKEYKQSELVRLDIFINQDRVEAFSMVVHKDKAYYVWRDITLKLKEFIPRHMFAIPLQAWIWAKIIARETIPALKKDVLAKCYGWDVTRKRKLLAKQKEWKKKLKSMWKVSVPNDIFIKMVTR